MSESSKEGYGSKRAVLPTMMTMTMMMMMMMFDKIAKYSSILLLQLDPPVACQ
jgi:hypothetical protein